MSASNQKGPVPARGAFVAGEWTVEPSRNLLLRGNEHVRLEPRVMDALIHLSSQAGQVVSKEGLVESVWQGRCVTDEVLTVTIYALRKALGDDARQPRYIETVSRRGYRWIAAVTQSVCASEQATLASAESREGTEAKVARLQGVVWARAAAGAIVLVLLVTGALWVLRPVFHSRHVASAEAHEAYAKGRFFLDQRSIQGWHQALEQFERSVALDPKDPAARAGLADTYSAMSDFGVASPQEMRPRAMEAAKRALALDANSAEGYEALGRSQFLFDWDFVAAEHSLDRAVNLNPDFMPTHQAMAWLKSASGQYVEAVASAQRALQLDPVNTARYNELAWVLALGGRYDEALHQIERALLLNPRSFETYLMKGWTYELAGRPETAFAAYREGLRIAGAPEEALQRIDAVYRAEGLVGFYANWLDLQRRGNRMPMSDTWRAQLYVRAGQRDHAIESLERAYQKHEGALAWVRVEPSFQPLRTDPRFEQIAARVGYVSQKAR